MEQTVKDVLRTEVRSEKQSLIAIYRQSANDATNHGICDKVGTFFVEKQVVC